MRPELQKKIDFAIRLLKAYDNPEQPIEIAYSGGKDSDVILQLAKEAGIHFRAIYRNTTIDPPGTIKHVKAMGVEILQPKKTFFQLIEENGLPNRFMLIGYSIREYREVYVYWKDSVLEYIQKDRSNQLFRNCHCVGADYNIFQ